MEVSITGAMRWAMPFLKNLEGDYERDTQKRRKVRAAKAFMEGLYRFERACRVAEDVELHRDALASAMKKVQALLAGDVANPKSMAARLIQADVLIEQALMVASTEKW